MTKDRAKPPQPPGSVPGAGDARLERAIRQMMDVETGRRARPAGGGVEIVDDPDIGGIRRSLGLTQRKMADMLKMPIGTLRNWEQGRRKPSNAGKLVLRLLADFPQSPTSSTGPSSADHDQKVVRHAQLAKAVAEATRLTSAEAQAAVEAVLGEIAATLAHSGAVTLQGFGNLRFSHRGVETRRDPKTGDVVEVELRSVAKFVPGKDRKDAIN